jgi:hypothetical protein
MPGRTPSSWVGGRGLYTSGDCMHRPGAQPAHFAGKLSAPLVLNSALPLGLRHQALRAKRTYDASLTSFS